MTSVSLLAIVGALHGTAVAGVEAELAGKLEELPQSDPDQVMPRFAK